MKRTMRAEPPMDPRERAMRDVLAANPGLLQRFRSDFETHDLAFLAALAPEGRFWWVVGPVGSHIGALRSSRSRRSSLGSPLAPRGHTRGARKDLTSMLVIMPTLADLARAVRSCRHSLTTTCGFDTKPESKPAMLCLLCGATRSLVAGEDDRWTHAPLVAGLVRAVEVTS